MITLIDLGIGNTGSLSSALAFLGAEHRSTRSAADVRSATVLLLPGVGSYDAAIHRLDDLGLRDVILEVVASGVPTMGICLGMQLLLAGSEEGRAPGLGVFEGIAVRLGRRPESTVPHVGFDRVHATDGTWFGQVFDGGSDFYFTHSFALAEDPGDCSVGLCDFDGGFIAAIERWPVVGVQFHPEKSQSSGLTLLAEFLRRAAESK